MKKIFINTTVPITFKGILVGQPKFLSQFYNVSLVSSPDTELEEMGDYEGVATFSVRMVRGISPLNDLISVYKMYNLLRKHTPDAVHSYTPKAGLVTMLAGFLCRVPVRVHTFTGLIFPTSTGIKQKILIWMDRLICACATTIIPEGNGVKQDLINYGITKKKLNVIGHGNIAGVDTDYFNRDVVINEGTDSHLRAQLNLPKDAFLFCFVGRFTLDKGFSELIVAFNKLPENAHLVLVGEMDTRIPLPPDKIKALRQHSRIHNLGWRNDIRPALTISDVVVLPSYREGFPNVPLQAGAMQLPSIVTDINGCNEIITSYVNGWIIPPKDSVALEQAMLLSMSFPNIKRMGINARVLVQDKFERHLHWQNMLQFYNSKLANSKNVC